MAPGYWQPRMASRLEAVDVVEVDGDHEAMLTAPHRLAATLLDVARLAAGGQA